METNKSRLLPLMKKNNLMELFPKILNVEKEYFRLTPSNFIKEMSMSTEERHKLLVQTCNTKQLLENNYPPQLRIIPNILVFQKFEPRSTNVIHLQIRNTGKTILPLKMHCPESLYFSASPIGTAVQKLAPGLCAEYKIVFTPKEINDYSHELIFHTKEQSFSVPIIAIGPRAILDIPDQIILNPAPVKLSVTKCIVIRNIGDIPASFNFITQSPFKVSPMKGYLTAHETMILNITFESLNVGYITGLLHLVYETGEQLSIMLQGSAENVNVRLEKNSIVHEDTFMGLKRCKSIRLLNNSSSIIKFCWKKYKSIEDDMNAISNLKLQYTKFTESAICKDAKVKFFEFNNFENHKNAWKRILNDELQMLEQEQFQFFHDTFTIVPLEGEVWPKCCAEIIVSFEPKSCTTISAEAYLEVSGRENRLPLHIRGYGLGPKIILNPHTLDIDYIYLCSHHKYEVIAVNKGDIPGKIEYKVEASIFGGKIEVEPKSRHLNPGECGAFIISFTSNKQGEFIEQLTFNILESGEMVSFILTGKIISPVLHFDRRSIDFGTIPFGFPTVQEVTLDNLSVVPVTFSLKVLKDGVEPSVSYKRFASLLVKPYLPQSPKEFHIDPEESVVEPFSSKKVTLTLTPNKIGWFQTHLEMDMWDSESGSVSCPISYHPSVPTILAEPESITIPFCFINYPYTRSIVLKNLSKVPGFFYIVPANPGEDIAMTCSANIPQGTIEPRASINVDITLITSGLGRQVIPINLLVFGHEGVREVCSISCVGQGPVVTVSATNIHWGDTPLLEEVQKTMMLSNESPIPATISIGLTKKNSPWFVSPSSLTLAPSESVALHVNLFLNDRGKFKDTLKLSVHNGKMLNVNLTATGVGSSLNIVPKINPTYDLGTLFSHKNYEIEILIENRGTKPYGLVWSPFQDYTHFVSMKLMNPSNLKFKFEPTKMDLLPGEHKTLFLVVQSSNTGYFSQTIYCFASIGVPTKELHFTSEIRAEFVEPLITFDKHDLKYWYNIGFDGTDQKLEDCVEICNMSVLSLRIHFAVRHPFRIVSESNESVNGLDVHLKGKSSHKLTIKFLPEFKSEPISHTYTGHLSVTFQEHSKKFTLELHGEVNYPNLLVVPNHINFDHVPLGSNVYRELTLVNVSPLTVFYQITWNCTASKLNYIEKKLEETNTVHGIIEAKDYFEDLENENDESCASNASSVSHRNGLDNLTQEQCNQEPLTPKMPKVKISKTDIKRALFPIVKKYCDCEEELLNAYRMTRSSDSECTECPPDYAKVCDITPFYGKLEKFSSQVLSVRFCSDTSLSVHLEAMISIKSGPTEIVTIDAIADDLKYSLDTTELEFGKQLFSKPSCQTLRLRNTGGMAFHYEVNLQKGCALSESITPNTGVISVSPTCGILGSFSDVELNVTYLPMVPGKFEKSFKLEIAYLDPVFIKIKGYGVFPQVHLALPRTDILKLSPEIGYIATASITSNWLLTEYPCFPSFDVHAVKPYRSQESNLDSIHDSENMNSYLNDWEFIEILEYLPTEVDLQLAIERIIAINLLSSNSASETNFAAYIRSIPLFYVPAYEVDFGVVVIGRCMERTVGITNYGPLPAVFYVNDNSHLKDDGILIRLKSRNELIVGASLSFSITFAPKKNNFKKQIEAVESVFYFEIYHGPKIPIKILSTVTYPFLIASSNVLNYYDVICGCCKVMNLKLKNPGLVPASWNVVFLTTECNKLLSLNIQDGRPMFHLNYKSGVLQPEEYCTIQISFKPDFEGSFTATLWVRVEESLEELNVLLTGEGIEPKVVIHSDVLTFGPTPPYPNKLDQYFTIENPCSFPIEFYFPSFDEQIYEEDRIIRAVCTYYQSKEILLPVRRPGEGLPVELINFYQMLVDDLNAKVLEQEKERLDGNSESSPSVFLTEEDRLTSTHLLSKEKTKKRTRKSVTRTKTSNEPSRQISESESFKNTSVYSVQQKKGVDQEEMLQNYIRELLSSNPDFDPIQCALKSTVSQPKEEEYKEGLLIIFYGAPYTNSVQLANRAALVTGLSVLNIDRIVLEEATFARCEAGIASRELIEEAYWDYVEIKPDNNFPNIPSDELNKYGPDFGSTFEEIERKFNALLELRENLIQNKNKVAKSPTTRSETSKRDKPASPLLKTMNLNAPVANITEDLVMEILKFRVPIEISKGMILENLESVFINKSSKVLVSVLKAAGNIRDILSIFLLNNYTQYNQCLLMDEMEKENVKCQMRAQLLELLEEEDDEKLLAMLDLKTEEKQQEFLETRELFLRQRHANHELFEKNTGEFYERLRSIGGNKMAGKRNDSGSKLQTAKKKEVGKSTKLSDVPGGRSVSEDKGGKGKGKDPIEIEFATFELELTELKLIVESWDQRTCNFMDVPSEVKPKKGQSPSKVGVESNLQSTEKGNLAQGVQMWLVDVSRPEKDLFATVCHQLKTLLENRHIPKESDNWPLVSPESMTFSVVSYPTMRKQPPISDIYTLTFSEPTTAEEDSTESLGDESILNTGSNMKLNRSTSQISFRGKRRNCPTAKKKKDESRSSVESKTLMSKKLNAKSEGVNFKSRWILAPGQTLTWRVRYFPMEPGVTEQLFPINVVNREAIKTINCIGICDIPALDMTPETLYPNVVTSASASILHTAFPAFFYSENAYDFGSIVHVPQIDGNRSKQLERKAEFTLLNKSALPVDLTIISRQDAVGDDMSRCSVLNFEPERIFIKPGESHILNVTVCPYKDGPQEEFLLLLIKDNPKIELIKLKFEGVKANVTVEPKAIDFDRVMLHRKDNRHLVFTNNNLSPLYITLCDLEKLPQQITFSSTQGWITPTETLKINVCFDANEIQQITEESILVKVFDSDDADESVQEFPITLSAEAYDVALDVIFSEKDHVDFGCIRVQSDCNNVFNLRNMGKYPIHFKIDMNNDFLNSYPEDRIWVSPDDGILQPGKGLPVTASINAKTELLWQHYPLLFIVLLEPNSGDELVAKIPIEVSVQSFFPRYELMPFPEFNFGHVKLGLITTGSLVLENKGQFPLSYVISPKSTALQGIEKQDDTTKRASKPTATSKEKEDKGKKNMSTLSVGPFEITPTNGIIDVGQIANITVSSRLTLVKAYEEFVIITLNESPSSLQEQRELLFLAEGCLPAIDFFNFKTIFREHFVAKRETELNAPTKFEPYTLFTENNLLFSFKNTCLCKAAEARIHIPNSGLIGCQLTIEVKSDSGNGNRRNSVKNSNCFDVFPNVLLIEAYNFGTFTITFRPETLGEFRGQLLITLEMPDMFENIVYTFDLFGNGVLPHIEIIEPVSKLTEGQTLVNFAPTTPKRSSNSSISFTNIGLLTCKVIVEICNNQDKVFTLIPKRKTENMLQVWESSKPIDHTVLLSIMPGEVAEFSAVFSPLETITYTSHIKLFIVDNPFENLSLKLIGEGYFEEVTIERIQTSIPFLDDDLKDVESPICVTPGQYHLNFNDCYVKKESKALLRLSNKTQKEFFKFEWDEMQHFAVSPSVGHLYPNSYKEILVTFQPDEPVELDEVALSCTLNKIVIENPPKPAWDSRLMLQKQKGKNIISSLESNNKKDTGMPTNVEEMKINNGEPLCDVLPETNRMLFVIISGIADYARLYCEATNIIFKNTFMFQTRIYPLALQNCGNVTLDFKLTLSSVTACALKESKVTHVGEQSFTQEESRDRPQSWVNSSKSNNFIGSVRSRSSRPRPLSSGCLLNLRQSTPPECEIEGNLSMFLDEEKTVAYNPFAVENSSGQISAGKTVTCNIIFAPMDISEYRAILNIQVPNLHPECKPPQILIAASSVMPFCHFNIPESDYLESGRRDYSRPGPIGCAPGLPLSPDTKTIEIKVLGIGHTVPIKFHVINPTDEDYTFSWINITQILPDTVQSFHCSTLDGRIQAGRQQQMVFSFVSQKIGITESFWKFSIPENKVETQFLLVGDVREPSVHFLSNHINLRPNFIGGSSCDTLTLVNNEDATFDFKILPDSMYSEGRLHVLDVEPTMGKILPNSEFNIKVTFTGKTGGKILFFLKCKIKGIKEVFTIAVESTTYVIQPLVVFEDFMKVKHHANSECDNFINLGKELIPNCTELVPFYITSISKTSLYYDWIYDKEILEASFCKLKFSTKSGHISSMSKGKCDLSVTFSKKSILTNFRIKLKIRKGPTFTFVLNAGASIPSCEMSFTSFDFGHCFLQERDICYYEVPLIIRNTDSIDISLEGFLPTTSAFSLSLPETSIEPRNEVKAFISFHPREKIQYVDVLKFIINGLHEKLIELTGCGTEFKVALENPKDTTIRFGAVKVGKNCSRTFCLINKSLAPVNLLVGFSDQLPVNGIYLAKPQENFTDLGIDHRLLGTMSVVPSKVFTIKPQETFPITLIYTPVKVCCNFSETISLQFQEKVEPLCVVTGCCIGPEISLDRSFLNFGAVVKDCSCAMKLKLLNTGSVGAKFIWLTNMLGDEFSLHPASGYCFPESDITIQITFNPKAVNNCIKSKVECKLELSETEMYPSLLLSLSGSCISVPQPKGTISFECFVRDSITKTIEIENWTGNEWQLLPIFSGEYYKGRDALIVQALSIVQYEISYCPLMMTPAGAFHEGSVFFRLPNGQGLLYKLLGTSLPPKPEEILQRQVPCKTKYVELLKVQNWLQCPQRLKVDITCLTDLNQNNPLWSCSGLKTLDLPPLGEKEFNLNFFAYKPDNLRFHVSFVNEETKEFKWFDITFNIVMCGPLEVISLKCGVRQTCYHEIKLENPLDKPIQYKLLALNPEIQFDQIIYNVDPRSNASKHPEGQFFQVYVKMAYTPIHVGEKNDQMIAECSELGSFPRELRLSALSVQPEPSRIFETPLGTSQAQMITVKNLSHLNATLNCSTDSNEFFVREVETAGPGQETGIQVIYEPSEMTTTIANVFIDSPEAGKFVFPLMGICLKPLAKGPFLVKLGETTTITFKNVFTKSKEFYMYVDNSAFTLKQSQEQIAPKAEYNISIELQKEKMMEGTLGSWDPRFPLMGQLIVECYNPYVKWQFYLKGVVE